MFGVLAFGCPSKLDKACIGISVCSIWKSQKPRTGFKSSTTISRIFFAMKFVSAPKRNFPLCGGVKGVGKAEGGGVTVGDIDVGDVDVGDVDIGEVVGWIGLTQHRTYLSFFSPVYILFS